ncbi:hypothetical protein NSTCB13_07309 [Nostoc sp. DSM 114160]|jgi:hypothetical protein
MRVKSCLCIKYLEKGYYSRFDVYEVQQLNQIQSLKSIPKIGVPHLSQKCCKYLVKLNMRYPESL